MSRANHQRHQVIPKADQGRNDDQKNHRCPMHREDLVVHGGTEEVIFRPGELDTHQQRKDATHNEKDRRRPHIKDAYLLVVDAGHPAEPTFARFLLER